MFSKRFWYQALLLLLLLLAILPVRAQQDWTWTFGDSVVMHFPNGGAPVVDLDARSRYSSEGGTTMGNLDGSLRFYVGGNYLRRRNGLPIPNSSPIGFAHITNPYIPLPVWGDTTDYLIFVVDGRCAQPTFCPWLVEIRGAMGQDSVSEFRNLGLYHPSRSIRESVSAVRDASGTGWWVLYHGLLDSTFIKFHVAGNQVSPMDTQMVGSVHGQVGQNGFATIGEMSFSPNGDKLLVVAMTGLVDVFDFDRCTGELSNWQALGTPAPINLGPNTYYGCSFSPDGTKIYVSEAANYPNGDNLYQYDLSSSNVLGSKTLIFTYPDSANGGQHQLGPDGKIYVSQRHEWDDSRAENFYLSVINDPNQVGLACNFNPLSLYLEGLRTTFNLPSLPNFNLAPLVAQVAEAGPPQIYICPGDSVQIGYPDSTNGLVTYAWTAHPDISDTSQAQVWVTPVQDTWYFLTAVDSGFGLPCGKTIDSVHVIVADSSYFPELNASGDTTICYGDTISLLANASVGNGNLSYLWLPNGETLPYISVSEPGTYQVVVNNPIGVGDCFSATDWIEVDTFPALQAGFAGRDSLICRGDSVLLGLDLAGNWSVEWSPILGLLSPDSSSSWAVPALTTQYILTASDTNNTGSCGVFADTVLTVVEQPFIHETPESQQFCPGEVLTVGVSAQFGFTYAWTPIFGLTDPFVSQTTVAPMEAIVYSLAITSDTMISENCKTQFFPVALSSDGCVLQNVLTPNGDGINDVLNLGTFNAPVSLSVFDRWGHAVFVSDNYRNDYDGAELVDGVYWFVLKVAGSGGKSQVGEVTVLR